MLAAVIIIVQNLIRHYYYYNFQETTNVIAMRTEVLVELRTVCKRNPYVNNIMYTVRIGGEFNS